MDAAAEDPAVRVVNLDQHRAATAREILDDDSFAALMEPLGPFERRPRLAVAVSGGADSMALALLLDAWAARRNGSLLALTVDHGLRPGSRIEAETVGRWLNSRGIAHDILTWGGAKPDRGLQEAARTARYGLLLDRCRAGSIVHLMLAHHRDDQAETVLLRLASGSGPDGLAAMAEVSTTSYARLLRPLLPVPRARLEATLIARGQAWIEDPSNSNQAFQRVRLRNLMPALAEAGLGTEQWAELAGRARAARTALDEAVAAVLARSVKLYGAGYACIAANALLDAPRLIGMRAFERAIRTVSGAAYGPRADNLERLWMEIRAGLEARRTLGGCLVMPSRQGLIVQREPAAMAEPIVVASGQTRLWDGRFIVRVGGRGHGRIGALGSSGWLAIKGDTVPHLLPAAVLTTLPALIDPGGEVVAVPHLGWRRKGFRGPDISRLSFAPLSPLTGGLVWHGDGIMC